MSKRVSLDEVHAAYKNTHLRPVTNTWYENDVACPLGAMYCDGLDYRGAVELIGDNQRAIAVLDIGTRAG